MVKASDTPVRRRDMLIFIVATGAISLLIAAGIPIGCAANLMAKYHTFVQDLGESLQYAREHETLELTIDGQKQEATLEQADRIYERLADAGMGSPLSEAPDSDQSIVLAFGDENYLQLFPTTIEEPDGSKVEGLVVCFQRRDGRVFAYDTDQLSYQKLLGECTRANS